MAGIEFLNLAQTAVQEKGAMQKPLELADMLAFVAEAEPRTVVEIGGMRGGTAWAWWRVMQEPKLLVTVDSFVLEGRMENGREATLINGDSHDPSTLEKVVAVLDGRPVDFLFIDGDHSYEGVRKDFEMYAPLVRHGGVIGFHDVSVEQPARVRAIHDVIPYWNQVKDIYDGWGVFFHPGPDPETDWGGIGTLVVPYSRLGAVEAAKRLGAPTPEQRMATVPLNVKCLACGGLLTRDEEDLCAFCAGHHA